MQAQNDRELDLSQLIDGDLSADEAKELRARLDRDMSLRNDHDALVRVDALVRAAAVMVPRDVDWATFRQRVSCRIAADRVVRSRRRRVIRVVAPLAAAAAVALFVLFRPSGLPSPEPLIQVAYAPTESIAMQADAIAADPVDESGVAALYEAPPSSVSSKPAGAPRRAFIVVSVGPCAAVGRESTPAGAGEMF